MLQGINKIGLIYQYSSEEAMQDSAKAFKEQGYQTFSQYDKDFNIYTLKIIGYKPSIR